MGKAKPIFLMILAVVSILGFAAIALDSLKLVDIKPLVSHTMFVLLGMGLLIEGGIINVLKGRDLDDNIAKLVTLIVGMGVLVTGAVSFFNVETDTFLTFKAIASGISIMVIIWETWVIK